MNRNEILLQETQRSYDCEIDLKNNYENKANYNIAINGIIIAILLGALSSFAINNHISLISFYFTIVSIILIFISLGLGVKILRITDYSYVYVSYEIIQDWKKQPDNDLITTIMDTYIFATKLNMIKNSDKLKLLKCSQAVMVLSIIIIGITIVLLAIGYIY